MSKITLFAEQTSTPWGWKNVDNMVDGFSKKEQLKYREQAKMARQTNPKSPQNQRKRKAYTHLICEIGGAWLTYFPECKTINPYNEAELAGVVRAFATLAKNEQFLRFWTDIQEKRKASGGQPLA